MAVSLPKHVDVIIDVVMDGGAIPPTSTQVGIHVVIWRIPDSEQYPDLTGGELDSTYYLR